MIITKDDGTEIEVYTAEEVQAKLQEEVTKVKEPIETELANARKALSERAGQFAQFRKLNEETVAKLSEAERVIYENSLALEEARIAREAADKQVVDSMVETAIRAKAGKDEKLVAKMRDMWSIIGIDAVTPESIENKARMVLGAISTTEPDLLASVAGFSGSSSWTPDPVSTTTVAEKSFADTDAGKAIANELGLKLEVDKK